jgi:hypothetical protein
VFSTETWFLIGPLVEKLEFLMDALPDWSQPRHVSNVRGKFLIRILGGDELLNAKTKGAEIDRLCAF